MSEPKNSLLPESLTLQSSQSKTEPKHNFQNDTLPESQSTNEYKKDEENDYDSQFKLIVKEKVKEKLKHDQTQQFFTVVINQIIEERVKRNFVAVTEQKTLPDSEPLIEIEQKKEETLKKKRRPSDLDRLKARDQQVKRRIKELMKKRPKKRTLTTYQIDLNRDKGFILGKKMIEIKQKRQIKYLETKKQLQERKSLVQTNLKSDISQLQNDSTNTIQRGNRRFRRESEDIQLPRISQNSSYLNQRQTFRGSKSVFQDPLSQSKIISQRQIFEDTHEKMSTIRYDSVNSTAKSSYHTKKANKRDLSRQIQILRKSKIITAKYHIKKMAFEILTDIIFDAVKIVEKKKQFFFNTPPKPIHEIIRQNRDLNSWKQTGKQEKFRVNITLKQIKKEVQKKQNQQSTQFPSYQSNQRANQSSQAEQRDEADISKKSLAQNHESQQKNEDMSVQDAQDDQQEGNQSAQQGSGREDVNDDLNLDDSEALNSPVFQSQSKMSAQLRQYQVGDSAQQSIHQDR